MHAYVNAHNTHQDSASREHQPKNYQITKSKMQVKISKIMVATGIAIVLSACGNIQTIKSFSTEYIEPTEEGQAKIRVFAVDGMVRGISNSNCEDWRLPGAGVMISSTKGFANRNNRDLGMPPGDLLATKPEKIPTAKSELRIKAGVPFYINYMSQGNGRHQCFIKRHFTPKPGALYEASFAQFGERCYFSIQELKPEGGIDKDSIVSLSSAKHCRASDML
jgi:hypothetical protein